MIVIENIRTFINGELKGASEHEVSCSSFAEGYANAIINHIKLMHDNTTCVYRRRSESAIYFDDVETDDTVKVVVTLYTPLELLEIFYDHKLHEPVVKEKIREAGFKE